MDLHRHKLNFFKSCFKYPEDETCNLRVGEGRVDCCVIIVKHQKAEYVLLLCNIGKAQHGVCVVFTKPYPKKGIRGAGGLGKPKLPNTEK